VVIRNDGGDSACLHPDLDPPYTIVEGMESREVPPGGLLTLHITMATGNLGNYEQDLAIIGGPSRIVIPILGTVVHVGSNLPEIYADTIAEENSKPPLDQKGRKKRKGPIAAWAHEQYARTVGVDTLERKTSDAIPVITEARLALCVDDTVHVAWPQPTNGGSYEYVLETRWTKIDENSGLPQPSWVPLSGVEFEKKDGIVIAKLEGVPNETQLVLRVLTTDGVDLFSKPSLPFAIKTWVPEKGGWFKWVLLLLIAGAGGGYWWWQRRQLED
jgi:hypothetical protein